MKEALVVCGGKNLAVGVTIWDMETGDHLLHIPTCASPFHGLTCLRHQYLVASQIQPRGSVSGGVIFTWPFSKPRAPLRSYPLEAIGPLSSSKDGIYLAGGATSGNVYVWEVINGKLLKTWHAHNSPLTCLAFSDDASLLISGSEDGMIVVWPMIRLLDETDSGSSHTSLSVSTDHESFITGLLPSSNASHSVFVSSSLDGTCKVWDLVKGTLLQTCSFPQPITASVLDPAERFLFSGSADGRIFMSPFDVGLMKEPAMHSKDKKVELNGHKESITALTFSRSGLISASEDFTACLWDVVKGFITNLVVIPYSSLLPSRNHQRKSTHLPVSLLKKCSWQDDPSKGTVTLLPSPGEQQITHQYQSANLLNQQILDLEVGRTPEAIQLKVETNIESRLLISNMTKHVMEMNNHLQSRLLDLTRHRISQHETEAERNKL
ncbi:G-protein beta WD-40 repeat-containing protein [Cynara cardunculus var. scolymus]|uniref:G-protein beta WD-40 repeat-containing protein n=1 Tax=Cynara cardunculus var. scolymus TaxID=59895 RepID=A0A124SGE9_CYNCS|nr:G-protein beta WD-40 repeat-containing protein [Cynara cardunculus var. scolymus]